MPVLLFYGVIQALCWPNLLQNVGNIKTNIQVSGHWNVTLNLIQILGSYPDSNGQLLVSWMRNHIDLSWPEYEPVGEHHNFGGNTTTHMHPSAHSLNFCSDDPNSCLPCGDPSVVNPSQKEDVFIPSRGAHSSSQILICPSGDTSDTQTDGTRRRMHVALSVFLRLSCCRFLSPSRPLVY